jgi:SAM-dependent methyltransferase
MRRRALAALAALGALAALACGAAPVRAADEVPFIVTPDNVTVAMLALARVTPRDFVLDLGSGDGRIVITAAKRFGARGLGVEIVPDLVALSRRNAEAAGVADRAHFVVQDLFQTDLTVASVITMYLLPELNLQLRPRLLALAPGTRIVSHDWDMDDWEPDARRDVDAPAKTIGREKRSRLYLWVVPARLQGHWCNAAARLRLEQRYQRIDGVLEAGGGTRPVRGRVAGRRLHTGLFEAELDRDDGSLRLTQAGAGPLRPGNRFERCTA